MHCPPEVVGPFSFPDLSALSTSGVYFLHHKGQVVYVGQAKSLRQRIGQHISEGRKVFDAVSVVPCDVDRLGTLERRYIRLLLPQYNQCAVAKGAKAPLELKGVTLEQPAIEAADIYDDVMAARFLGISVEALREHQRLGHGPRSVRRPRSKVRRYPVAVLRKFAARHLGAANESPHG